VDPDPGVYREVLMRALVYHGPGQKAWDEVPRPGIIADTDAIVRVDAVTICGTDLHILKGDVPAVIESVGSGVKTVKATNPGRRSAHPASNAALSPLRDVAWLSHERSVILAL
jgi:alcohol dehydrogenase